jgi:hypothetical protein
LRDGFECDEEFKVDDKSAMMGSRTCRDGVHGLPDNLFYPGSIPGGAGMAAPMMVAEIVFRGEARLNIIKFIIFSGGSTFSTNQQNTPYLGLPAQFEQALTLLNLEIEVSQLCDITKVSSIPLANYSNYPAIWLLQRFSPWTAKASSSTPLRMWRLTSNPFWRMPRSRKCI